tara:strand:+ start:334 stop:450 length:117 start_codon:yes stop_codon:yes gene_type:complete
MEQEKTKHYFSELITSRLLEERDSQRLLPQTHFTGRIS